MSGVDTCDEDTMCWNVNPQTNEGTCVARCGGPTEQPTCEDDNQTCVIANQGVIGLCFAACDPREPAACPEDHGCYPTAETFACLPYRAQVQTTPGDAAGCEFPASCEPGTYCYSDDEDAACDDEPCCASWCDTDNPDACGGVSLCVPWAEDAMAPDGLESLGWCAPSR